MTAWHRLCVHGCDTAIAGPMALSAAPEAAT
jgi:hypothetical protein